MASSISSAALASASLESQLKISSSMMNIHANQLGVGATHEDEVEHEYEMEMMRLHVHDHDDDDDHDDHDDDDEDNEKGDKEQRLAALQRQYSTSYDQSVSFMSQSESARKAQAATLPLITTIVATDTVPINVVTTPELHSWKEQRGRFQIHHQRYSSETNVSVPRNRSRNSTSNNNNNNSNHSSSSNNLFPDSPSVALTAEKFSDHKEKLGAFSMSLFRPLNGSTSQEQINTLMAHSASSNSLTTTENDKKEALVFPVPKQTVDKSLHHSSSFDHSLALTGQETIPSTDKQRIHSSALSSSSTRTPTSANTNNVVNGLNASKVQYTSPGRWHMAKMNRETLKQSADKFVLVKGKDGGYAMAYELGASIATTDEGPTPRMSMEENAPTNINEK